MSGTDASAFTLDGNTLKTAQEFEYEIDNGGKQSYSIDITVDQVGNESMDAAIDTPLTKTFNISVLNINEPEPEPEPEQEQEQEQ